MFFFFLVLVLHPVLFDKVLFSILVLHFVISDNVSLFSYQGTTSVVLAGLISALNLVGGTLADHKFLFLGAGEVLYHYLSQYAVSVHCSVYFKGV